MDQKRNFIVGIVSLILLISTSVLIIWKSDVRYRTSGYKLTGKFDNAGGLLKGAEIRYRGYRVGKVSKITPVPGGVGPMTIACLLKNTLTCFKARLT